jgi:hypothetical protein
MDSEKKHLERLPYDKSRLRYFVQKTSGTPSSPENNRDHADAAIQAYIDSYGDNFDEYAMDNVEDTISSLMHAGSLVEQRDYDRTRANTRRRLTLVIETGAQAMRASNQAVLEVPVVEVDQKSEADVSVLKNEIDDMLLSLHSAGILKDSEVSGGLLILGLRETSGSYEQQRPTIAMVAGVFYASLTTALKDEPTKRVNGRNVYKDKDIEEGAKVIYALKELLKVPETKSTHPFEVLTKNRSGLRGKARSRDADPEVVFEVLTKVKNVIEYAFRGSDTAA